MASTSYDISLDPEANIRYEKCADVDAALWRALAAADPQEVTRRTGAAFAGGTYRLPFLGSLLSITPARRHAMLTGQRERAPEFQLCLVTLLYLLKVEPQSLGPLQVSPKEFKGGTTFFQGPHALPTGRLEARFGQDRNGLLAAAQRLGGRQEKAGDAAVLLPVFPGLEVGVILWEGDEEFPAQVNLTVPQGLDRFWPLDAVWALLNVVTRELWRLAPPPAASVTAGLPTKWP